MRFWGTNEAYLGAFTARGNLDTWCVHAWAYDGGMEK